jgi:hypothetical protein
VGLQALILEIFVGRLLIPRKIEFQSGAGTHTGNIDRLGERLEQIYNFRRRQFGLREALAVGIGTLLIALGCALYLAGLLNEPPPA